MQSQHPGHLPTLLITYDKVLDLYFGSLPVGAFLGEKEGAESELPVLA